MEHEEKKKQAYRIGTTVLILLVFLTIGEFIIGSIVVGWAGVLIGIALIKAFFVIRDYMHINRLINPPEEVQS
jgi:ABC-type antimicrobial peptide transport system permease subunit